jgi:ribosomal protein S18 acetylase RimI-like enzyme
LTELSVRRAEAADLTAIVALLADDVLGAAREHVGEPLPAAYGAAFAAIDGDKNQLLLVGESAGRIVGCLQLSFLPGLSHRGAWRAQIEAVRIASAMRGRGFGEAMIVHAIALARERRCRIVQLTTDRARPDALRFYRRLGFAASHDGLKLALF